MIKPLLVLTLSFITTTALADRFKDSIHSYSKGKKGQTHLIYLESGRVVQLVPGTFELSDFNSGEKIDVEVNEKNQIEAVSSLPDESLPSEESNEARIQSDKATILPSYSAASSIFSGMNRSYKSNTECTDRAHVWSYEEWRKKSLISRKVFLFFTNTYIRRYNFGWWFHVSPYTLVGNESGSTEYVMDRRYTSAPRTMKTWTDVFIRSKRTCPSATYRHYRNNKNGVEHCFITRSNMYNRLPYHVRMEEDNGRVQTKFNTSEVNFSYRAFNRRGALND